MVNQTVSKELAQSYSILESLRLPNNLYVASPSSDYNFTWMRDTCYECMPYLDKTCNRYEKTYHAILDIYKRYEYKLTIHTKQKPKYKHEYIHPRYTVDGYEVDAEWGNKQHDSVSAVLFGIGEGIRHGKKMLRDEKDREIVQKLVLYLECCEYWKDPDNGVWEEYEEVRSSSLAACVAGLRSVKDIVDVPEYIIDNGMEALYKLFPYETKTRKFDLAQLTLIYPYNIFGKEMSEVIIKRVEEQLVRDMGVIRYHGDSYYSTLENDHGRNQPQEFYHGSEAEWTFGFGFLALAYLQIRNKEKAAYYVEKFESVMLEGGELPELYYAKTSVKGTNSPLGWSQAMYILSREALDRW